MFYPSLETRWFLPGLLDESGDIAHRFLELPFAADPSPPEAGCTVEPPRWPTGWREDRYLRVHGREDIGIKLRRESGGAKPRAEFKGRLEGLGRVEVAGAPDGVVERWAKWSVPADEAPPGVRELLERAETRTRVTVRKRRILRMLRIAPDGGVYEVADPSQRIDRGIGVELVRLQVGTDPWWSIGFEAFPDVRPGELQPQVRRVVEALPPDVLADATSCGYPAWLLALG